MSSISVLRQHHIDLAPDALLDHVLDTIPTGLFTVDGQGVITSWNDAMTEMTGYVSAEVVGKQCGILEGDACFRGPCGAKGERCRDAQQNKPGNHLPLSNGKGAHNTGQDYISDKCAFAELGRGKL